MVNKIHKRVHSWCCASVSTLVLSSMRLKRLRKSRKSAEPTMVFGWASERTSTFRSALYGRMWYVKRGDPPLQKRPCRAGACRIHRSSWMGRSDLLVASVAAGSPRHNRFHLLCYMPVLAPSPLVSIFTCIHTPPIMHFQMDLTRKLIRDRMSSQHTITRFKMTPDVRLKYIYDNIYISDDHDTKVQAARVVAMDQCHYCTPHIADSTPGGDRPVHSTMTSHSLHSSPDSSQMHVQSPFPCLFRYDLVHE